MKIENTYSMPVPNQPGTSGQFLAVLTSGMAGDFACYLGIVHESLNEPIDRDIEWVAHSGLKIAYREAVHYFPFLKQEQYRN